MIKLQIGRLVKDYTNQVQALFVRRRKSNYPYLRVSEVQQSAAFMKYNNRQRLFCLRQIEGPNFCLGIGFGRTPRQRLLEPHNLNSVKSNPACGLRRMRTAESSRGAPFALLAAARSARILIEIRDCLPSAFKSRNQSLESQLDTTKRKPLASRSAISARNSASLC